MFSESNRLAKVELEEAGLETEGMAESTSTLQAKLKALTHGKVDIMVDADTFKNTTQILREMSQAWEDMTDIEQASALELMGGKRQANILASVITNFETVEDVIETTTNAEGSALRENEKYLDSIQGRLDQFTNSLQTFWNNFLDSRTIKEFVEFGTNVIEFLDTVPGKLTAVASAIAIFSKVKGINMLNLPGEAIREFQARQQAMYKVTALSGLGVGFDTAGAQSYAAVIRNLTTSQQAATLAAAGFNAEQIRSVMLANNVEEATIREVLSKTRLTQSTQMVKAAKVQEAITTDMAANKNQEAAISAFLNENANKKLSLAILKRAVDQGVLTSQQAAQIASDYALTGANNVLGASFVALGNAIKMAFLSNPIGVILTIATTVASLITVVCSLTKSTEELAQAADEAMNKYQETNKTLQEQKSTIDELSESYKKLSKGVNLETNENVSLTTESYEEYLDVCNKIADMYPELVTGFDAQGNAILSLKGNVDELTKAYEDAAQANRAAVIMEGDNVFDTFKSSYDSVSNASWDNTGNKQKIKLAEELLKIVNDGNQEAIDDFFDKLNAGTLEIDGQSYSNIALADLEEDAGIDTSYRLLNPFMRRDNVDIEKLKKELPKFISFINSCVTKINTETNKVKTLMSAYLGEDEDYKAFSKETQQAVNQIVSGLDAEFIRSFENTGDLWDWIKDNIVTKLKNNPEISEAFSDITEIEADFKLGKISYGDYKEQLEEQLDKIQVLINDDKTFAKIKVGLGLDEDSSEQLVNNVKKKIKTVEKEVPMFPSFFPTSNSFFKHDVKKKVDAPAIENLEEKINSLSAIDLEIAANLDVEDGTIESWDQLLAMIKKVKAETGIDVKSSKTYSAITESIDSFNEVQKQTEEIIANDTEVTQEYKDALVELGISADELKKYFYENNELVVKDADGLKALIKYTKKTTNQNVKLAKSQARLQYYDLYKKLRQLTNGQKITSAATLTQVKTLYAEMTALQKTISRYSLLEQQLLGATNAYEKFAEAQEIDEATDYETQAEEMIGSLVDAFHTAKLGSESAQAAITGLVPESVYEDLDTLDAKMQAVYDYFTTDLSKYFYVKFNDDGSMESAEMLIDNVKKFVEDGIGKGVFTGSWEEWDLDPSVKSLDELAEKMNVTKEVAFAFLQAMETYDISWIGGDASTLLDKLIPNTTEIETFASTLQEQLKNTSIKIKVQPEVETETLEEAGWEVKEGQTFEVGEYLDSDGSVVTLTPILPNGEVVNKEEFDKYVQDQLNSGGSLKDLTINGYKVYIDSFDTLEAAKKAANQLESDIKDYQSMQKNYNLENAIYQNTQKQADLQYKLGTGAVTLDTVVGADGVTTVKDQLGQLNEEAGNNTKVARDNITAWSEAQKKYDVAKTMVEDLNKKLSEATDGTTENEESVDALKSSLELAEDAMWDSYAALVKIGEPTEVVLTIAEEQVQQDLANIRANMSKEELDIVSQLDISNLKKDEKGNWIVDLDAYSNLDEESKTKVQQYLDYLNEEHNINILHGEGADTTLDVLTEIKNILEKTYEIMVETDDANEKAQSFANLWNNITDKSVTLWAGIKEGISSFVIRTPKEGDGADVNGTAHVGGTAFAGGSWGAPKTETALVGELGEELLVRGNHWTTVGQNGAEFTQVKKGDVIFNHKQTKQLLENGYVTSRGKAYASGTAFSPGSVHPWLGGMNIDDDWTNIDIPIWNEATNGEYLADDLDDATDSANDFNEVIDWIEIGLEEINEQLDLLGAKLENAVGYVAKNNIIGEMMSLKGTELDTLVKGVREYETYANKFLYQIPVEFRESAKNGAIGITEFVGEANEATVEAINNYREWAQKAADLRQQVEELKTELADLARQRFDNVQKEFDNVTGLIDNKNEKLEDAISLKEDNGYVVSKKFYEAMKANTETKSAELVKEKATLQATLDREVQLGRIKKYSDAWYEMIDVLYEMDAAIMECQSDLYSYQDAINDIYWDNFDELINRLDYLKDETQSLIDLVSNDDLVFTPETKDYWSANEVKWTDEGLTALGLYAQQMEIAEYQSKQYEKAIEDLTKERKRGNYTESEYLEKLNELKSAQYDSIEAYHDAEKAIVDLNSARVDSIKEGIEKEVSAFEKLINAKKEALETEKD